MDLKEIISDKYLLFSFCYSLVFLITILLGSSSLLPIASVVTVGSTIGQMFQVSQIQPPLQEVQMVAPAA